MTAAIRAREVVRRYGERAALDGLSLDVDAGSVFGILGPNGSGKSTFLALVAGGERPDSGDLEVLGERPSRQLRARIGTVFQENAADPLMTPIEYLGFAGRLFGVDGNSATRRGLALLEQFGLAVRAKDAIGTLSGGMRRRLEVARALLHRPELLLLDEPTTGVDPEERRLLWQAVLEGREGATVVLATNDLHEADAVCSAVAFIQRGRVVAVGSPTELKRGLRRQAVRVDVEGSGEGLAERIAGLPGAGEVAVRDGELLVTTDDATRLVPEIFAAAGASIRAIRIDAASLEDAYFQYVERRVGVRL